MAAPKLEWKSASNIYGGRSIYAAHWLLTPKFQWDDHSFYIEAQNTKTEECFQIPPHSQDAKAWCQAREDEAYAAANPVREYSDTEILTALLDCPFALLISGDDFVFRQIGRDGSLTDFRGKNRREAIAAYLRANPPALLPATEPEPSPDREMTGLEINETFKANDLDVLYFPNKGSQDKWKVWKVGYSHLYYCSGSDLFETIAKCLAAIEAAKARNA